ncbi:MAG TPA: hypothetical protein VFQ80_14280, partial [Thermomicrobiales bacterium]|nr:hypothetical protein [Thermomicrobiales bacterium]
MRSPAPDPQLPTDRDGAPAAPGLLDRTLEFDVVWWAAIGWTVVLAAAIALRFAKLGAWALSPDEARRAYDAWILMRGQPAPAGEALPTTEPLFLLLQSIAFFVFGATDAIGRIPAALCGFGIVALTPLLRRWVGAPAALGMAALAAISPTLVYASRVADPEPLIAFLALLLAVAILRAGIEAAPVGVVRRWAGVAGFALAALLAAGPSAITVLIALVVAFAIAARDPAGAPRQGLRALAAARGAVIWLAASFVITLLTLFSRLWSDPAALVGIVQTFGDWAGRIAGGPAAVPTSFFLLSLFLYEPVSLLLALVGAARGRSLPAAPAIGTLFGAWFVAALLLWSFSNGRTPQQAIHVAMPLVLLAGGVFGDLLARIDWDDVRRGDGGAIALAVLGLIVGLGALGVLLHRAADPFDRSTASITAAVVVMAVIVPLVWALRNMTVRDRAEGRPLQPARIALAVVAALLATYGLRSATQLSLYRAADGTELLAQRVATGAVIPAVDGINRLSRDVTIDQGSVRDVTGGHGLTVAAERSVEWPFRWYFRDYPDFSTIADGAAAGSDAQVVIAPGEAVLTRSGYTVHAVPWRNGVPGPYADPDPLSLLAQVIDPRRWFDGVQFLLFREGIEPPVAANVNIGLNASLAARVSPATGPYNLSDRPGPGSAAGQFDQPIGVAAAPDGTNYVVDSGNARVERFDATGSYLGAWDAKSGLSLARTDTGLGPTGITVGPDGTIYVADTWNHRVV